MDYCDACPVADGRPCLGLGRPRLCDEVRGGNLARRDQLVAIAAGETPADPDVAAPGLLAMAGSFARAATAHAAGGFRLAPPEAIAAREAACRACPHHDAARDACRVCGCSLPIKRSWPAEQCPDGRWPAP